MPLLQPTLTSTTPTRQFLPGAHANSKDEIDLYGKICQACEDLIPFLPQLQYVTPIRQTGNVTPLTASVHNPNHFYKREDLTATRAYKVRGAFVAMQRALRNGKKSFSGVSTGNHAMGLLCAAEILKPENITIIVPSNIDKIKKKKLENKVSQLNEKDINATLSVQGSTFDEAQALAKTEADKDPSRHYIDPFGDLDVISGQGTLGRELVHQLDKRLCGDRVRKVTVIAPVGGGGLLSGAATAVRLGLRALPQFSQVETQVMGLRLENSASKLGDAIKVQAVHEQNMTRLDNMNAHIFNTLNDNNMAQSQAYLLDDLGVKVEGASAGTVLPILEDLVEPSASHAVVSIISGANV